MFTGIVETTGTVRALRRTPGGARLEIGVDWPDGTPPAEGDSVAVNGACLTAIGPGPAGFSADLSRETLERTLLGELRPGDRVNLERALRVGDRVGGHLVQGHVDAVVRVVDVRPEGEFARWRVTLPEARRSEVALKGSVALDGVSLTVAGLGEGWFEVALIPATLEHTTLSRAGPGSQLHLETDVIAKYVARCVGGGGGRSVWEDFLSGGNGAAD